MSQPHEFDFDDQNFDDDIPIPLEDPELEGLLEELSDLVASMDIKDVIAECQASCHHYFLQRNGDGGSAPLWGGAERRFERLTDQADNLHN